MKSHRVTQTINFFSPSRIRFFKKVPEKQKINFSWPKRYYISSNNKTRHKKATIAL